MHKLVIPIEIPSKESKAEIEIHPGIVEAKSKRVQYNLELYKPFYAFYSSIHLTLFLQVNNYIILPIFFLILILDSYF